MMNRMMKASEFQADCLQLIDEVAATGAGIVITMDGRAVCELIPHQKTCRSLFGRHRDQLVILGDILTPPEAAWEAEG